MYVLNQMGFTVSFDRYSCPLGSFSLITLNLSMKVKNPKCGTSSKFICMSSSHG